MGSLYFFVCACAGLLFRDLLLYPNRSTFDAFSMFSRTSYERSKKLEKKKWPKKICIEPFHPGMEQRPLKSIDLYA